MRDTCTEARKSAPLRAPVGVAVGVNGPQKWLRLCARSNPRHGRIYDDLAGVSRATDDIERQPSSLVFGGRLDPPQLNCAGREVIAEPEYRRAPVGAELRLKASPVVISYCPT